MPPSSPIYVTWPANNIDDDDDDGDDWTDIRWRRWWRFWHREILADALLYYYRLVFFFQVLPGRACAQLEPIKCGTLSPELLLSLVGEQVFHSFVLVLDVFFPVHLAVGLATVITGNQREKGDGGFFCLLLDCLSPPPDHLGRHYRKLKMIAPSRFCLRVVLRFSVLL